MSRLVAFVKTLLGHFRDETSDEGVELIVETADRVTRVVEEVRRLADWLEFGVPGIKFPVCKHILQVPSVHIRRLSPGWS